jgi:CSLREA domain-containing protein
MPLLFLSDLNANPQADCCNRFMMRQEECILDCCSRGSLFGEMMKEYTVSKRMMISVVLVAMFLVLVPMISTKRVRANTFTVTSLNDSGAGSLRQAILDANSNPGDDTINITVTGTIPLDSALPDLSTDMTINGPGARLLRVERHTTDRIRIFTITVGATVNISGLRVSEGYTQDYISSDSPAVNGGGIYNSGTLILTAVNVVNNHAGNGNLNNGAHGGGIFNDLGAILIILNSTIRNNEPGNGPNAFAVAGNGGGIYNSGALTITNSTIYANRGGQSGSTGTSGVGGGIYNTGTGEVTLTSCTIAENFTNNTITLRGGGVNNSSGGTVRVRNTIIANNGTGNFKGPDYAGTATSGGFNILGRELDSSGFTQPTDQKNVDPRLFPIGDNGGQTETCALLFLSPAIDKGKNFASDALNQPITTDQRGRPRPFDTPLPDVAGGDGSDIGAYEANDDFTSLVVNSTADTDDGSCDPLGTGTGNMDCTLREAINAANRDFGAETITFDPAVFTSPGPHVIQLTGPLPDIISDTTINGPGANLLSVRGGGAGSGYRIFTVTVEGTVNISELTVTNGYLPDAGEGSNGHSGGGIINFGTLNLTGVVVSGNRAGRGGNGYDYYDDFSELIPVPGFLGGFGGGIYNQGTLTLLNCTVSGNQAGDGGNGVNGGGGGQSGGGGGIYSPIGTLTVINSTITNNQTGNSGTPNSPPGSGGGGINNNAALNIINCTISGNQTRSGGKGGAIDGGTGTVTISNSTITANTATGGTGGGIFRTLSTVTLKSTIVAGNSATNSPDIDGAVQSDGFNLIQNTSGTTINQNPSAGPNITGQDPLLAPLANNGGPTETHALNPTSPAVDKGKNFANGINTDQRGYSRPVDIDDAIYPDALGGDASDIGAFESVPCTITCPANKVQSNDPNQCGAIVNYSDPMTSGDLACGTITCSPSSGSFFPKGTTTVVCNASGTPASSDCTFTVTVNDTQNPSIACPGNISQSTDAGQCIAVVTYKTPVASDNCSGVGSVTCMPASGTTFPKGTTTVNCTVKDASNNNGACSFTITVNDTQNPAIVAPANITRTTDANQCTAVVTYTTPAASDNCAGVGSVTCTPANGTTFQKGVTTVTCSATDTSNNTGTGSFTVTVNDNQPPSLACPANVTVIAAVACPAITGKVVTFATPTASDNCPGVTTAVCNPPSGSTFPLGVTTVTCTAKDASNNTATCSFTVNFSFNACIQDDSNSGNVILFNTVTGAYRICCNGTVIATGVGTVTLQGCDLTLQHNEGARRVLVKWSSTTFKGSATVNLMGSNLTCSITDRDIRNNTCNCQ